MDFQAIVRDQLGLMVSWIEGGNQVTVTRDSAGRPLLARAAGSRSKPYAAEFRYDQSGRFLGVRGEFVSVMFPRLLEEAARGGGGNVTATTGPGGGNRKRGTVVTTGNGVSGLPVGRLQELLSWVKPIHLPILDPAQLVGMTPITTTDMSITHEPGAGDYSADAIRITTTAAVTNKSLLCPLPAPLEAGVAARPVRAGQQVHFRVKCSDWTKVTRLYVGLCQDGGFANRRFFNICADSAGSSFGHRDATYDTAWSGKYRTFPACATRFLSAGTPTAWGYDSKYFAPITGIFFTVSASAAVTFDFDRIYSPDWPVGIVTPIFDGWYQSARELVTREFLPRGWGAGGSANEVGAGGITPTYADLASISRQGFDVFCHGHDIAEDGRPQGMTSAVTAARYSLILSQQRAALLDAGSDPDGMRFHQWLQNLGDYAGSDMAGLLRSQGIIASRGPCSDARWGINPAAVATTIPLLWSDNATFLPMGGQFNRIFQSAYENVPQAADYEHPGIISARPTLRKRIEYAAWAGLPVCSYHHNILDTPGPYDVSTTFARGWVAHMEALEKSGSLLILNPTTLEDLTFARADGVRMGWDGEWYDADGNIAF